MKTGKSLKIQHSLKEFGLVHGDTQQIRINSLHDRLKPAVGFPHRHSFYHLVLITEGRGFHEIDFKRYEVKAFQFFFMKPGQVHTWELSPNTKGFVIEFEKEFIAHSASDSRISRQVLQDSPDHQDLSKRLLAEQKKIVSLLRFMQEEYENKAPDFELTLEHYLAIFLIEISKTVPKKNTSPLGSDPFLSRFFIFLEQHFDQEHEVAFYAKQMKTSAKALTMRCSRAFKKSARTLILDRVLLEAKRLLVYSDFSIHEVSDRLGFLDPNYFARFFKKGTGLPPGAFRKKTL